MPRTRSLAWAELKIGIVAVAALILAVALIWAVGGQGGFSWEQYELKTKFGNVQGLKSGAVVRVAGVEVGKVTDVEFAGPEVQVTMKVNNKMQERITEASRAQIGSLSLLGEPIIDITPSTEGRRLQNGDFIQSDRSKGQISDVAETANQGLAQATALLKDIRAGKGTVGKLFTDEQLYRDVDSFISSAEIVAGYLSRGQGTLGMLVRDPAAYQQLKTALGNLQEMTQRINAGQGSIGKLLNDDAMAKSLTAATSNIDQLTGKLNRGEGTAGKLLTDQQLYDRLNSLTARMDGVASNLEKGQGTAGQLLHDKQLYENMNAAASELRALIGDIRKDPKKYLNVRVSLF